MNYIKMMIAVLLVVGLLVGCNNKEPKVESGSEQMKPVTADEQVMKKADAEQKFPFTHFSIEVDYGNDISYEAEYENERDGVSAEIEDEVNQVYLKGDEALTQLSKKLELLTIDEQSTDDEVLEQVLDVFKVDESYKKIEVEVTYNGGKKKEYNYRK